MIPQRLVRAIFLCLTAAFLMPFLASAQSPVDPPQLPARTSFYFLWRGTPSGDIRTKNSLYALWDDPDFAPARSAFLASLLSSDKNQKDRQPTLTPEEMKQYVTLLDNPFLFGYLHRPESAAPKIATSPNAAAKEIAPWNGSFFIYDRTGKEELLSMAVMKFRSAETDIPKLTNLTVGGVPALKVERKSGTAYWAEFGKYAVSANEQSVFEEVILLLNGKSPPAALSHVPAFVEAKPLLGGLAEFFLNVSNLKELAVDASSNSSASTQFKPFLDAFKLDTLHSIAGHLALEDSRTRVQAAILGDAAPGGLFDVFTEGQATPASMAFLSPDTLYYSESQMDFLGLYKALKRAFAQAGGNTNAAVALLDAMAANRLGMPLEDALALTTGEFASLQTSPAFSNDQKVYFLGIRNKPDALKLTRTLMGDRITSERNEGNTTFLKISLQGNQSKAGVAQWNFYYLAMTPNALLGAPKGETLHQYLDRAAASDPPNKAFQSVRTQFPEKLNGLTFLDFQHIDWPALKAQWIAEANKAAQDAKSASTNGAKATTTLPSWINDVDPAVFPRHLHTLAGASWKDAKGVHLEEWLE
jgi:hypothetical protein